MCCLLTIMLFLGPRIAAIVWWLWQPFRWVGEGPVAAFDSWVWPVLGIIFLPWTTLMWVIIAPAGVLWWEWLFLAFAVVIDLGAYGGGGYGNRRRFSS
jgi:hypothetical protein